MQVNLMQRSIGLPLHGVMVKLSEGGTGEIRIKSPLIFSAYLGDEEATRAAFDEEGYYKTGDLGHFDGNKYIIIPSHTLQSYTLHTPYILLQYHRSSPEIGSFPGDRPARLVHPLSTYQP